MTAAASASAPPALAPVPALAILCLSLAAFGSGINMRLNDALLPQLATEFSVGLGQAAAVTSVFSIAYGIAQLFVGSLGERFGKFRLVAGACLGCALSAALCALAPDFGLLRLLRGLAGIMAAAVIPLSMAWIGDVVGYERRQPVLARFMIGQILGVSAGVWMGGFAADHLDWRAPYFVLAALFAAVGVALFLLQRRLPAHARATRVEPGSPLQRIASDFRQVFAGRWARVILACVFLEGMLLYGPFAFIAAHLHVTFALSLAMAGTLLMLFGLGGLGFALASRRLVAGLGEVGLARQGGAVAAASLLLLAYAPAWGWVVPACLGAGVGFYMLHNTLQVNATQMVPERRGPAVSAFAACFFLGQAAGVSLSGWLSARIGTAHVIALGALGLLLVAWAFGTWRASRDRSAAPAT
ncbi:MFS transporter [Caldimonas tepidiphila]|uniref:MFS transporter n=1 Tax=Caldimonas tepidiphila TaxID=2315841 RepID=UPI000E5C4933|nr:MFS transporter [Caldimonas tepidiphila]